LFAHGLVESVSDVRECLVHPEEENCEFTPKAKDQRAEKKYDDARNYRFVCYIHDADHRARSNADPENHLNENWRDHGAKRKEVAREIPTC